MYIHIRNQEIYLIVCVCVCVCVCVVIYNKLLLNHLWSCVLKLINGLHDLIWVGESREKGSRLLGTIQCADWQQCGIPFCQMAARVGQSHWTMSRKIDVARDQLHGHVMHNVVFGLWPEVENGRLTVTAWHHIFSKRVWRGEGLEDSSLLFCFCPVFPPSWV